MITPDFISAIVKTIPSCDHKRMLARIVRVGLYTPNGNRHMGYCNLYHLINMIQDATLRNSLHDVLQGVYPQI